MSITNKERYIKQLLSVVSRSYTKSEVGQTYSVESRNEDLLICVLEGESVYEVDGHTMHLHEGDVLFLSRGSSYKRVVLNESYRTVFVYFRFDGNDEPSFHLFHSIEGVELSFIKLYRKWSARLISYQSECMSILYGLYSMLIRSETSSYLPKAKRELFDDVVHYISDNYTTEDISVAVLAEKLGMSEVHFRRCFKKIHKIPPQEYITALRIVHAKELLQYDSRSVDEISQSLGLSDSGYFSRLFKLKTGYTPSEYRSIFKNRTDE